MPSCHHLSALLLLAGSVAALPQHQCISTHAKALLLGSRTTSCGDARAIAQCLSSLARSDSARADLEACYLQAGCSASQAAGHTAHLLRRCRDADENADDDTAPVRDLKKRRPACQHAAPMTTPAAAPIIIPRDTGSASPSPSPTTTPKPSQPGKHRMGRDCFTFGTTSTASCLSETINGKVKTRDCKPVPLTTSDCLRGYICTLDRNNLDVCMEAQNNLDTGGIVLAIVFGSATVLGLCYVTYACCQERKQNRQTAARAEAVALARAATKKERARHVRTPLMPQAQGRRAKGTGAPNPFQ